MIATVFAVAIGGALGVLARFQTTLLFRRLELAAPWSTLLVNVLGSFAIGAVWAWCLARPQTPDWVRVGLMTGVLGGYTTFSAVALETVLLFEAGLPGAALAHVLANAVLGVAACAVALAWLRPLFAA